MRRLSPGWQYWDSISLTFTIRQGAFDSATYGLEVDSAPIQLGGGPPDCRLSATVERHLPEPGQDFEPHFHFRILCRKGTLSNADATAGVNYGTFLEAVRSGLSETGEVPTIYIADLDMPANSQWLLPLLTSPPDLDGGSIELGSVSLAGVTLDFEDSKAGLRRVFMESDFDHTPARFRLMATRLVGLNDFESLVDGAIDHATRLARLFVKGLPDD